MIALIRSAFSASASFAAACSSALAGALGVVHGGIRLAQQARTAGPGAAERDADARARKDLGALDDDWRVEAVEQPLRHDLGLRRIDAFEQNGELVASEPCDGVGIPHRLPETAGDTDQQLVTRGMTEAVVDGLEVVDVDEENSDAKERAA